MKRRWFYGLAAFALSASLLLSGCGGDKDTADNVTDLPPIDAGSEPATPPPADTVIDEGMAVDPDAETPPAADSQDKPTSDKPAADASKPNSSTSKPNAGTSKPNTGTSKPNTGTSKPDATKPEAAVSVKVSDIWSGIGSKIGEDNIAASMQLTAENITDLYGIAAADLKQVAAYMPMINVKAEEFFIAEVADGKMDTVEAGIKSRQSALAEQWKQYLPDQHELVEKYQIVKNGNYIFFGVSENLSTAVEVFNAKTKA